MLSLATPERERDLRRSVRLGLVVVLSLVAFHRSVGSLLRSIESGSVVLYVLAVPLLAGLAAAAGVRRREVRVASATSPVDVVVGTLACLVALGASVLLGPGLSGVYGLWRLDLLMLWLFLLGATVLTFGRHRVVRGWPCWAVLLLLWPFPVRLANTALGSTVGGALLLLLVVLVVVAYGHRPHDPPRWQVLGSAAVAGVVVLALCRLTTHPQRLLWPAVVATAVAAVWWVGLAYGRSTGSVHERTPRTSAAVLVGLALLGALVLPAAPPTVPPSTPTGITALSLGPLVVPGFTTTATSTSKEQQRFFGSTSTWQRLRLHQGGRDLVVDVISTPRPQVLELYPVVTTYPMGTLSSTPDAEVDLGHGVAGQLFRAEDTRRHLAYTLLTFSWRLPVDMAITGGYTGPPAQLTQRVTLIALDDHRPDAVFPEPGNATLDGIRAVLGPLGTSSRVRGGSDVLTDEQLLDGAAGALVDQRLTGG